MAPYIGGMAHDFNNLFGIIIGNLDIAVAQNRDEALQEPLRAALDTALRAAQINRRLHAVMRPQPLQPRLLMLDQALPKMLDELRAGVGEGFRLEASIAPGLAISVDPDQLLGALQELVRNATEAMPEGGTIMVSAAAGDGTVRLAVADSGGGMAPDLQGRAFDPFVTTRRGVRGAGLGLSLVRGFAERSGGGSTLDSRPGATTVTLELPRAAPRPNVEATRPGGATVLVVEDNAPMRTLAQTYLTEFGYRAELADSAESALAVLRDGRPVDLLFTDLLLPGGLDGRELARAAMRLRPGLKCLVTTGGDVAELDGLPVLPKPYRKDDLARAVRDSLGIGR